jgi:FO synthase
MLYSNLPFLAENRLPTRLEALALASVADFERLMAEARRIRDGGFHNVITYSRKVFIPLTHLCRNVCHYCTFAQSPKAVDSAYLSVDAVLETVREAALLGCKEALFTMGERPELRYQMARDALAGLGFASTIDYLADVAGRVFNETGVLPHINAGSLNREEIAALRPVSASMGMMLENVSPLLAGRGMPHFGSPDKAPERRLDTLRWAGEAKVPFTSGLLIGIGETRLERIESLLILRDLHEEYGHLQEIIIQNFRAKPDIKMAQAPEPDLDDLLWTIAVARLIFGAGVSIRRRPI